MKLSEYITDSRDIMGVIELLDRGMYCFVKVNTISIKKSLINLRLSFLLLEIKEY